MTDDKKSKPVQLTADELAKLERMSADLPGLMEYAHNVGGVPIAPTEEGAIKHRSIEAMKEQTTATMDILADFLKLALSHARKVQDRVEISADVYGARIAFTPLIGNEYFIYERKDGERVLSLVGPAEWGANPPFKRCISRVKLLHDHTWQVMEKF